jgi:L-lactate dehydrogenase (cytochrome)
MKVLEAADFKTLARRRVPRMFFDYVDSGAYTEATYRANASDYAALDLRQRVGRRIDGRVIASSMVGQAVAMPLGLAPTGIAGMQRADGEILAARAAQAFGVPFTLSTMSVCSIEDVARATGKPFWFQLYVMRDRGFVAALVERARAAGCPVLMVTLDLQVVGQRHKDIRNGLGTPPRLGLASLAQFARRPAWCLRMLGTRNRYLGNIRGHAPGADSLTSMADWVASQFDLEFDWKAIEWLRAIWPGKLILKGVMCAEDARIAAETGADAVVVSNHGGRQLDGAPSSIRALAEIADRVGDRIELHVDGGLTTGQNLFRALALGARAGYVGRAYLYALGAAGEPGVRTLLEIIARELDVTMALCGERNVADIGRHNLVGHRFGDRG